MSLVDGIADFSPARLMAKCHHKLKQSQFFVIGIRVPRNRIWHLSKKEVHPHPARYLLICRVECHIQHNCKLLLNHCLFNELEFGRSVSFSLNTLNAAGDSIAAFLITLLILLIIGEVFSVGEFENEKGGFVYDVTQNIHLRNYSD
jgi:hypothetical protein